MLVGIGYAKVCGRPVFPAHLKAGTTLSCTVLASDDSSSVIRFKVPIAPLTVPKISNPVMTMSRECELGLSQMNMRM